MVAVAYVTGVDNTFDERAPPWKICSTRHLLVGLTDRKMSASEVSMYLEYKHFAEGPWQYYLQSLALSTGGMETAK
jgi:hypothetical protein